MADVLISYKREDVQLARDLAKRLGDCGLSVWWDHNIPAGKNYDDVIEQELGDAKCVVVLWSSLSIESRNVKDEANEALRRDILIPVLIGNVRQPLGFRMVQAVQWSESPTIKDDEFEDLKKQVQRLIAIPNPSPNPGPRPIPPPPKQKKSLWPLYIIVGLVILAIAYFMNRNDAGKKMDTPVISGASVPGRFPQASQKLLTDDDVRLLSKNDLKIMRNEVFARHGYIFTTPEMRSYFSQFSWYTGKYENVNAMLSDIESQNVALIRKYE